MANEQEIWRLAAEFAGSLDVTPPVTAPEEQLLELHNQQIFIEHDRSFHPDDAPRIGELTPAQLALLEVMREQHPSKEDLAV